ncbi:MAG: hypothetical protein DRJ51_00110 [Thermoprotei archaeon]|nr:MAG: hypothetical protein DRJ51_00110 [Thermoprotei archaeon]RLF03525.1 MAG: hypothetical protein DRJ59_00440 [Thermoprotei archaeon]
MSEWNTRKDYFLRRLREEFEAGRVDPDLKDLLDLINLLDDYYTTSSCSGRIQVAEVRMPGDKFDLRTLGKWHWKVDLEDIKEVLTKGGDYVWLMVQGPIIHITSRNLESALKMLSLARACGFKHSGIQVYKRFRILIEIMGSEEMTVPLKWAGVTIVSEDGLSSLVNIANELLERSKSKLKRFKKAVIKNFHLGSVTPL